MIVYLITNKVNGMQYVGAAREFNSRKISHLSDARRGKGRKGSIQHAIRKFGEDNFCFEVIDKAKNLEELSEKEYHWTEKLNTIFPNGYNLLKGNYSTRLKNNGKHVSIEIEGKLFKTIKYAAEFYNINESGFRNRLGRGWSPEQAAEIKPPPENYKQQPHSKPVEVNGLKFKTQTDAAKYFNINKCTFHARLRKGFSIEQSLGIDDIPNKEYNHPFMKKTIVNNIEFNSIRQACAYISKETGVKARTIRARVEKGWSMDDVFSSEVSNRTRIKNRKPKKIYKFDGKIYKSSYELADRLNMNPSTVRLWICKNKDKTLNEIFLNKKLRG